MVGKYPKDRVVGPRDPNGRTSWLVYKSGVTNHLYPSPGSTSSKYELFNGVIAPING